MDITKEALEKLRFPTGRFIPPDSSTEEDRNKRIKILEEFPDHLDAALKGLTPEMLDTPYRPEGWTVRQLTHHIADSHLNCLVRFKLTLTEDRPMIKGYDQDAWAQNADAMHLDPGVSQSIIRGVHTRLVYVLKNMKPEDFSRSLQHNEWKRDLNLDDLLALYSWHSGHHLAHITNLKKRKGW